MLHSITNEDKINEILSKDPAAAGRAGLPGASHGEILSRINEAYLKVPTEAALEGSARQYLARALMRSGIDLGFLPVIRLEFTNATEGVGPFNLRILDASNTSYPLLNMTTAVERKFGSNLEMSPGDFGGGEGIIYSRVSPFFDRRAAYLTSLYSYLAGSGESHTILEEDLGPLVDEIRERAASAIKDLTDSYARRSAISDAGDYIPGSAKEMAALRRASAAAAAEEGRSLPDLAKTVARALGDAALRKMGAALLSTEEKGGVQTVTHLWPQMEALLHRLQEKVATPIGNIRWDNVEWKYRGEVEHLKAGLGALAAFAQALPEVAGGGAKLARDAREEAATAVLSKQDGGEMDRGTFEVKVAEAAGRILSEKLADQISHLGRMVREVSDAIELALAANSTGRARDLDADGSRPSQGFHSDLPSPVLGSLREISGGFMNIWAMFEKNEVPDLSRLDGKSHEWAHALLLAEAKKKASEMGLAGVVRRLTTREAIREFIRRGGRAVEDIGSPQDFIEKFGIRRIEFGNYVNDSRRVDIMQRAASSLRDLGDAIGLSDDDLSMGGKLGLCFGSRGKGKASAHYEPSRNIINMTRDRGDGSLAHEIGHALDFMGRPEAFSKIAASQSIDNSIFPEEIVDAMRELRKAILTSPRGEFTSRREEEVKRLREEQTRLRREYNARLEEIRKKYSPLERDAEAALDPLKLEFYNLYSAWRSDASGTRGEAPEKSPELLAAEYKLKNIQRSKVRELAGVEYLRLAVNRLVKEIKALGIDLRLANQSNAFVRPGFKRHAHMSSRVSKGPIEEINSCDDGDGEEGVFPSKFVEDATLVELNGGKKGYYTSTEELFARAFEAYVSGELEKRGMVNNYLVNIDGEDGESGVSLYPRGEEARRISAAFDRLMALIKKYRILNPEG